ncbi:MAG: response regulator [Candidatus Latescibacterota bacterium]
MPEAINALLIEDSPIHARLIQSLLDDVDGQRFEVDIADRMESGLQRLRQGGVDIVLLDLVLPDSQ